MTPSLICSRSIAALIACAFAALATTSATAQTTATTDPVGFITLNVAGHGGAGTSQISFQGLSLTRPVEYQGSAETVGASSLTDNEATWADNQFSPPGTNVQKYFVEITSGTAAGTTYDISTTTGGTKTITTAQPLAAGVSAGVTFKIRKHWNFDSVFGPNNEAGLGGGSAGTADQILIWNGTGYDIYYYQIAGAPFGTGWRKSGAPLVNVSNQSVYPEDGVIIKRLQSATLPVILMGAVKTGQTSIPIVPGNNFVANVYAAPQTLAGSNLYTGSTTTGVKGGSAGDADQILIWNGVGYDIYYYQLSGIPQFGNGWRKSGAPLATQDAGATPIPVGTSVVLKRVHSVGFNWIDPQHPATL